jgi:type 1 glutamine amidotransferase
MKVRSLTLLAMVLAAAGCGSGSGATPTPVDSGNHDSTVADVGSSSDVASTGGTVGSGGNIGTGGNVGTGGNIGTGGADAGTTTDASDAGTTDAPLPKINILAIAELGTDPHVPFVMAAKPWLMQFAADNNMTITFVENGNGITDAMLANYNLILQLNYRPFLFNATAQAAIEKYLTDGKGGWLGLHHAALYGSAVSNVTWPWYFNNILGQINYKDYIASFAKATVHVEEAAHPIFKGVPATFDVAMEEWYTWDKTPRPNVHVLGNVDENSYMPTSTIKMGGDHPVIWTNDTLKGKNLYIFMGHSPMLFQNTAWATLFRNAISWAGTPR